MERLGLILLAASLVVSAVGLSPCPDGSNCGDGQTCCPMSSGQYGCCPFTIAVCCENDGCCPEGYTCNTSACACDRASGYNTVTMSYKAPPKSEGAVDSEGAGDQVNFVQCPDGNYCPDKTTCCKVGERHYACCPYQSAQCCSDQLHCCPMGYKCSTANSSCVPAFRQHYLFAAPEFGLVPLVPRMDRHQSVKGGLVPCPDGNYCEDGQTCCLMTSGQYGCCPYASAVCCSDYTSCCPEGYTCRTSTHQCVHASGNHTVAALEKVNTVALAVNEAPLKSEVGNVRCPDGNYCLDGQTCCLLSSGRYGCCPYQHAQCCSDHSSCCPEGYRCKVSTHQCIHATTNHILPMLPKVDSIFRAPESVSLTEVGNVRCPDGNYCQDGQTCCLLTSGRYGCCPYQHAECCSDHLSCCPEGFQCKISTHQCIHVAMNLSLPMLRKVNPIFRDSEPASLTEVGNVRCPDGNYCLDGQTCCLLTSGRYGCCPYQHAKCCSDHSSCCPEGYQCKISTHQCIHATTNHTLPMLRKVEPIGQDSERVEEMRDVLSAGNVRCPDGNYCQDGQTCCLLSSGGYGCCPYQHAECCSDHSSCCPEGYRCKISTHQCIHATTNHIVPMLRKIDPIVRNAEPVVPENNEVGNVRCPDGNYCLDGQTCCLLTSGHYGCCPYQHAECCSDHSSCCPEGYQCRISTHQCIHAATNHSLPMLRKVDPIVRNSALVVPMENELSAGNVRCPDGNYCQDGQTCCLLTSGRYGCCPYQHAECCSDHSSCCPEGYRCKISTHQCIHATTNHVVPMLPKVDPIFQRFDRMLDVQDVVCPDQHKCLSGQTCCQLSSGKYGCCPLPDAVCCEDHKSCCPQGYVCHVETQTCQFGSHSVPMVRKVPAIVDATAVEVPAPNEICPDGSECDDDQTCCLLRDGSYGCCLYKDAVCCADKIHCCPQGYQCDTKHSQCISRGLGQPALVKVAARRRSTHSTQRIPQPVGEKQHERQPSSIVCPGKRTTCPNNAKCCLWRDKLNWFCCPYANGTCCSDGTFCCPAGFYCFVPTQSCIPYGQQVTSLEDDEQLKPTRCSYDSTGRAWPSVDRSCPDNSTCPDSMTCCPSGHSFSCCPFSNADCCPDGEHCCPSGFKCDSERQACIRKGRLGEAPLLKKFPSILRP